MPQSNFWPFTHVPTTEDAGVGGEASVLQKQLGDMEGEVKEMQMELAALRRDRLDSHSRKETKKGIQKNVDNDVQEIADEKFAKFTEVSKLREELIRAKNAADEERFQKEIYEIKLKELESKLNGLCCTGVISTVTDTKESQRCTDKEIMILKNQVRDLKDELEETTLSANEKNEELQEYRGKYLQAQQQVEELKRQLDLLDFDNRQVSDQIQIEIQKMKMQFQEKLHELAPLPDLLKGAQIELQEARQLQKLSEENALQLSNELQRVKEKLVVAVNCLNKEKAEKLQALDENKSLKVTVEENQNEISALSVNLDDHKCSILRIQEKLTQQENRFKEKSLECAELLKDLDEIRQETTRSLSRSKERAETMRRYLQTQISELERQLVQSRAQCRTYQKDRDEVRQRMQLQVNNLQESFELVEIRLRTLQGQVNSLKNTYSVIIGGEEDSGEFSKITNK